MVPTCSAPDVSLARPMGPGRCHDLSVFGKCRVMLRSQASIVLIWITRALGTGAGQAYAHSRRKQ